MDVLVMRDEDDHCQDQRQQGVGKISEGYGVGGRERRGKRVEKAARGAAGRRIRSTPRLLRPRRGLDFGDAETRPPSRRISRGQRAYTDGHG